MRFLWKKSMHFQIISVVLPNYTVVLPIISVVLRNHTDDLETDEDKNIFLSRDESFFDWVWKIV